MGKTESMVDLLLLKGAVSMLSKEKQDEINAAAEEFQRQVKELNEKSEGVGLIAISLAGLTLQTELEG